jgi:hypothetical protein
MESPIVAVRGLIAQHVVSVEVAHHAAQPGGKRSRAGVEVSTRLRGHRPQRFGGGIDGAVRRRRRL